MPKKKESYKFQTCEVEGCNEAGIHMWFAKKVLCPEHADQEFKKYMKKLLALLAAGGVILIGFFIF